MANYKERYTNERRKTTLQKAEHIKQIIQKLFPDVKNKKISVMLSRCGHYHYDKNAKIGTEELMLYDVLVKYGYNPFRVYKWFRVSLLPEDIKDDVEKGKLSQEKALKVFSNRYRQKEISNAWRFMEEARRIVKEAMI